MAIVPVAVLVLAGPAVCCALLAGWVVATRPIHSCCGGGQCPDKTLLVLALTGAFVLGSIATLTDVVTGSVRW